MAMRRRRFVRRRRRSPLSTRPSTETRWRQAWFNSTNQFTVGVLAGVEQTIQILLMNPTLFFEELDVTPSNGLQVVENTMQAMRGVHVGGVVWRSTFLTLRAGTADLENYLNDYTQVQERLLTQEVDDTGFPASFPNFFNTWRPLSGSIADDTPKDNEGQLVRVHKFKHAFLATGDNAFGFGSEAAALGAGGFQTTTDGMAGWGPSSLRLKRFIADNQQLVLQADVRTSSAETNDRNITWNATGCVYYRLGWR